MKNGSVLLGGIAVAVLALPRLALGFTPDLAFQSKAGTITLSGAVGAGAMSGDTTYRIGGSYRGVVGGTPIAGNLGFFPVSELKFPLDVTTMSVGATAGYGPVLVRLSFATNLEDDAGTAEDSDWGIYYLDDVPGTGPGSLDIFSESEAKVDATWLRLDLLYRLVDRPAFTLALGPGFHRQRFQYTLSDLDQWYPSSRGYFGYDPGHDLVGGRIGTYEVTYRIVAANAAVEFRPAPGWSVGGEIAIGYVEAEDRDDHLLRSKLGRGDCTGQAIMLGAGIRYTWRSGFFAGLSFDYLEIGTEGTQHQVFYRTTEEAWAGDWLEVDQEIESSQVSLDVTVGYRF